MGPVVDVEFENNDLPFIKDALEVYSEGKRLVMEVAQHIGNNTVRCIMLGASEGLCKDMDVIATGKGIQVPVGKKTLGRLFNVLGETIDGGESLEGEEHWVIHRDPPSFEEQSPVVEMLETGIKVIDLLAPYAKGGKIGLFGGAGVGKTVFTKGFAAGLGIKEPVSSPTFTILQVYDEGRLPFYHFDVYRISDPEEMYEIGFEEYIEGEGVCFIEWANLIEEILPEHYRQVTIEKDLEKGFDYRRITIEEMTTV